MLIAEDYLTITEGEYPVIKLATKALAVLKGQEKVFQKVALPAQAQTVDSKSLFEVLRALRKQIAEREQIPPYVVFADSMLRELTNAVPMTNRPC